VGQFESRLDFPPPHLDYAHHNDDEDTDQKDSDNNSGYWVLEYLDDKPDNSPPSAHGELLCQVHRIH
jgi:hypothetical protein